MPPLDLINRRLRLYQAVEVHVAVLLDGVRVQTRAQPYPRLGRVCEHSITSENAFIAVVAYIYERKKKRPRGST